MYSLKNKIKYLVVFLMLISCVEPFEIKTIDFESALVVEATITDELKNHVVKLSRAFKLEEDEVSYEQNANVRVEDDFGNVYNFIEVEPGVYQSANEFEAAEGSAYALLITTSDGRNYSSSSMELTETSEIGDVNVINEDGLGLAIYLNSFSDNLNARYYRYEYEETFKIVAQKWSPYKLEVVSDIQPYEVAIVEKNNNKEDQVCYRTQHSFGIIQAETNSLSENSISDFLIRYIEKNDEEILYRYSILIKQYVQSQQSFSFYKTLNELSETESIFSQNQPGFVNGNIRSLEDSNEKVIGFFEVSSLATKRIFFNRADYISSGFSVDGCEYQAPELRLGRNSPLIEAIKANTLMYYDNNDGKGPPVIPGGPYLMVEPECGDCRIRGTNIKPDFWID